MAKREKAPTERGELNLRYSPLGASGANPNRPKWQQRRTRPAAHYRPGLCRLRFGFGCARLPRPRGIAEIS
jgi:hypothetical protein